MRHQAHFTTAIIGAGPYGVSIAAHLKSAGVEFRIFGKPMHRWQRQMPKGMFLKSEGNASNLSDPTGRSTLERYCAENGLSYAARGIPVSREIFIQYALSFQREFASQVEDVMVTRVDRSPHGFELQLANGASATAAKVIVATGLDHVAHIPPVLTGLPPELLSHSSDHDDLSRFKGREVTVIGGGQSALETAALLSEEGASVRLLVRKFSLAWNRGAVRRSLYERLRYPRSKLGDGLGPWVCSTAPMLFHNLPQRVRLERVRTMLGPSGAWWLKDRVVGQVQILLSHFVAKAEPSGGRVAVRVTGPDGRALDLPADHIIAATGYRFDLQRLPFLSQTLRSQVRTEEHLPILSSYFESSVPGLYFTGLASASSFGSAMRFLHGADYTARRVSRHIVAARRQYSPQPDFQPACTSKRAEF